MSDIYLQITETPTVVTLSAPVISGALTSTVTVANVVTVALDSNSLSALENVTVTVGAAITGTVTVSNFPATQPVSIASVTVGNTVAISGTVTIGSALPAGTNTIGTVTANVGIASEADVTQFGEWVANGFSAAQPTIAVIGSSEGQPFPISGTVTASALKLQTNNNVFNYLSGQEIQEYSSGNPVVAVYASLPNALPTGTNRIGVVTIGAGTVTIGAGTAQIGVVTIANIRRAGDNAISQLSTEAGSNYLQTVVMPGTSQIGSVTASISGTVPISISSVTVGNSVTIGSLPAISGTVTANSSNGSLTTRFGSVTTANTAFATSAVTNANRKYLLIQNVTTASNVITVGVGFTPTTTQGIQLTAGAGLTFEGSYIPIGAVNLLSSVTASCFTILEA